mmetsp:Transcript_18186/g.50609  ORF Transcript_18186/g.50609 Transcript_18186/m.50609 type:complete len:245 (-) Transcript_18186:590-1324(-)
MLSGCALLEVLQTSGQVRPGHQHGRIELSLKLQDAPLMVGLVKDLGYQDVHFPVRPLLRLHNSCRGAGALGLDLNEQALRVQPTLPAELPALLALPPYLLLHRDCRRVHTVLGLSVREERHLALGAADQLQFQRFLMVAQQHVDVREVCLLALSVKPDLLVRLLVHGLHVLVALPPGLARGLLRLRDALGRVLHGLGAVGEVPLHVHLQLLALHAEGRLQGVNALRRAPPLLGAATPALLCILV